jgi:hypothetical protein
MLKKHQEGDSGRGQVGRSVDFMVGLLDSLGFVSATWQWEKRKCCKNDFFFFETFYSFISNIYNVYKIITQINS